MSKRAKRKAEVKTPAAEPVLMSEFPGLAEALAKERREITYLREIAFLDLPVDLCGVKCHQLKLSHWQAFRAVQNPLIVGGPIALTDAAQFLWIVSTAHTTDPEDAAAFMEHCALTEEELPEVCAEIGEYVDDAFMDMATSTLDPCSVVCSSACLSVDLFREIHKEFPPALAEQILALPLAAIFQFIRRATDDAYRADGRTPPQWSRLDKVRSDIVFERNATAQTPSDSSGKPSPLGRSTPGTPGTSRGSRDSAGRKQSRAGQAARRQ